MFRLMPVARRHEAEWVTCVVYIYCTDSVQVFAVEMEEQQAVVGVTSNPKRKSVLAQKWPWGEPCCCWVRWYY